MDRDIRYKTVKILITGGHITEFKQIFAHIPKTKVAADMGIHFDRFKKMMNDPAEFKVKELYTLAAFIEIDGKAILDLVHTQHTNGIKGKRRK